MPGRGTAARVMRVQRIEMTTQDMDVIARLMNVRYAEHRARVWCDDPARVDAGVRTVTAGPLEAALVRLRGFHYKPRSARPMPSSRWACWPEPGPWPSAKTR